MAKKVLVSRSYVTPILKAFLIAWTATVIVVSALGQTSWVLAPFIGLNFLLHEAGHVIGAGLDKQLVEAVSGSALEMLVVLLFGLYFYRNSAVNKLFWLTWVFFTVSRLGYYVADSSLQEFELITLGELLNDKVTAIHDWRYILQRFNSLDYATEAGYLIIIADLLLIIPIWFSTAKQISNPKN